MKTLLLILLSLLALVGWSMWKSSATGVAHALCAQNGGAAEVAAEGYNGEVVARCNDGHWAANR